MLRANWYIIHYLFQAEDSIRREKNLEEAKTVIIKQDDSLETAKMVRLV